MNIREQAEELLCHAGQLKASFESLSQQIQEFDETQNPHDILIAKGVVSAIRDTNMIAAIDKLPEMAGNLLPDLNGEVEIALHLGMLRNRVPHVTFRGNDVEVYDSLRPPGVDPQYSWSRFDIGIGAGGEAIVVAFAINIASAILYDFVKRLRTKNLQPQIDSLSAIAICEHELSIEQPSLKVAKGYAKPSDVEHALFEVTLLVDDEKRPIKFLVRRDGSVCGKPGQV